MGGGRGGAMWGEGGEEPCGVGAGEETSFEISSSSSRKAV